MKKRYAIITATAIAASLTACGVYGPEEDYRVYENNSDGIKVVTTASESAGEKQESYESNIPENTIEEREASSEKDDTGR